MKRFFAALRFLTVFPLPGSWGRGSRALAGSPLYFPVAGLLIGAFAGAVAYGLGYVFSSAVCAMVVVALWEMASGGLHLDGLADSADGLLSARKRERMLEIMRDSHIGVMGVMVVVIVFGLKFAALSALEPGCLWRAAVFAPVAGRCALVLMLALLKYIRPKGGMGSVFYEKDHTTSCILGIVFTVVVGFVLFGMRGACAAAGAALAALLFAGYVRRKLGGATGDTIGAAGEIAETAAVLILALKVWG